MLVTLYALLVWRCSLHSTAVRGEKECATVSAGGAVFTTHKRQLRHSEPEMVGTMADIYRLPPGTRAPSAKNSMFQPTFAGAVPNVTAKTVIGQDLISSLDLENASLTGADAVRVGKIMFGACNKYVTDDYDLVRELNRGSYGAVFEARGKIHKGAVAVKQIFNAETFNPLEIEPSQLGLPNNAKLERVYEHGGKISLVYELYRGGDLEDHLKKKGRLGMIDVHAIVRQLAFGIYVLHNQFYIHRDLKPGNIMLRSETSVDDCDPHYSVVINDYGTVFDGVIAKGKIGSGGYMSKAQWTSPNAFSGEGYGPEVDWHAFAVILYQLLFGLDAHPFKYGDDKSDRAIIRNIIRQSPNLSEIRNRDLKNLMRLLLSGFVNDIPAEQWWTRETHPVLSHEWWWTGYGAGLVAKYRQQLEKISYGTRNPSAQPRTDFSIFWEVVCRESEGLDTVPRLGDDPDFSNSVCADADLALEPIPLCPDEIP